MKEIKSYRYKLTKWLLIKLIELVKKNGDNIPQVMLDLKWEEMHNIWKPFKEVELVQGLKKDDYYKEVIIYRGKL